MNDKITKMFSDISSRYDITNDLLSFGIHRIWKKKLITYPNNKKHYKKLLDLCCGTADIAIKAEKLLKDLEKIEAADLSSNMLKIAEKKYLKQKDTKKIINFTIQDALNLNFKSNYFDLIFIGFGVRNFLSPLKGLKECYRVLKEEGEIRILEFGTPESKIVSFLYVPYSKKILPIIGKLLTSNIEAYKYLSNSALSFPSGNDFLKILKEAGFKSCNYKPLLGGISYIYTAKK